MKYIAFILMVVVLAGCAGMKSEPPVLYENGLTISRNSNNCYTITFPSSVSIKNAFEKSGAELGLNSEITVLKTELYNIQYAYFMIDGSQQFPLAYPNVKHLKEVLYESKTGIAPEYSQFRIEIISDRGDFARANIVAYNRYRDRLLNIQIAEKDFLTDASDYKNTNRYKKLIKYSKSVANLISMECRR